MAPCPLLFHRGDTLTLHFGGILTLHRRAAFVVDVKSNRALSEEKFPNGTFRIALARAT